MIPVHHDSRNPSRPAGCALNKIGNPSLTCSLATKYTLKLPHCSLHISTYTPNPFLFSLRAAYSMRRFRDFGVAGHRKDTTVVVLGRHFHKASIAPMCRPAVLHNPIITSHCICSISHSQHSMIQSFGSEAQFGS